MVSSGTGWQGLEEGAVHTCKTVADLVQHGESGGAAPVLERQPLELGKHGGALDVFWCLLRMNSWQI